MKASLSGLALLCITLLASCNSSEREQNGQSGEALPFEEAILGEWVKNIGPLPQHLLETLPIEMEVLREDEKYFLSVVGQKKAAKLDGTRLTLEDEFFEGFAIVFSEDGSQASSETLSEDGDTITTELQKVVRSGNAGKRSYCTQHMMFLHDSARMRQGLDKSLTEVPWDDMFNGKRPKLKFCCPAGGTYAYAKTYTELGQPLITCSKADGEGHVMQGVDRVAIRMKQMRGE